MGEGSHEYLKPEMLEGRLLVQDVSQLGREESYPPANPALISRIHAQTPHPWAGAGRGAAACALAHAGKDFSEEAQSQQCLPCSLSAGRDLS